MDRPFDVVLDTLMRINPNYAAAFTRCCARLPNAERRFFQDGVVYPFGNMSKSEKYAIKGFIIIDDEIYICNQEDDGWYQTNEGVMI